jgi:hypothetical protein
MLAGNNNFARKALRARQKNDADTLFSLERATMTPKRG